MVSFGALEVRKGGFLRHILDSYSKLAIFFFFYFLQFLSLTALTNCHEGRWRDTVAVLQGFNMTLVQRWCAECVVRTQNEFCWGGQEDVTLGSKIGGRLSIRYLGKRKCVDGWRERQVQGYGRMDKYGIIVTVVLGVWMVWNSDTPLAPGCWIGAWHASVSSWRKEGMLRKTVDLVFCVRKAESILKWVLGMS